MTKDERALWALDVMGGIDAALIEEAEAVPRRTGRRIVSVAAVAALLTLLAVGGAMMHRRDTTPPIETSGAPATTTPVIDSGLIADQAAQVRWNGVYYEMTHHVGSMQPGEALAVVEFDNTVGCMTETNVPKDDPRWDDMSLTASNTIPVGGTIYACAGYAPEWRICGYDASGELYFFARTSLLNSADLLVDRPISSLFPAIDQIKSIELVGNNGVPVGEIDDPAKAADLLQSFIEEAVFISTEESKSARTDDDRQISLQVMLSDSTTTRITVYNDQIGGWLGYVRLPAGFYDTVCASLLYPDGNDYSDYDFDYGNTSANNIGLMGEYTGAYEDFTVWLEGSRLYLGSHHGSDRRVLLADDAAGDIRIEGLDVFYRTTAGAVVCITYACPGVGSFYSLYNKGIDMTDFIAAQAIVDPGPYVRFQLRLGVRWTLDADGRLARDGVVVAEGVRDFNLDAGGVVYATAEGAYRRADDGTVVCLTDAPVTAIATSGLYVYYATEAGELHRVRCDGARDALLGRLDCAKLAYSSCNGSSADCLAILTTDGRACFLMDGVIYTLARDVVDLDAYGGIYLHLTLADGTATTGQLDYFSRPDPDYGTPAGLQFEGIPIAESDQFR